MPGRRFCIVGPKVEEVAVEERANLLKFEEVAGAIYAFSKF